MCTPIRNFVGKKTGSKNTMLTGVAPGTSALGMLVDPLNLSGKFKEKEAPIDTPPDPAAERAAAEGEATQRANAQIAMDQRRRRGQQSLLAKGSPTFGLGDQGSADGGLITGPTRPVSRGPMMRIASMLLRGARAGSGGVVGAGSGGVGGQVRQA